MTKKAAAFFDLEGTLIEDTHYRSIHGGVRLIEKTIPLCETLQQKDYPLFIVTNQSGIARGLHSEEDVFLEIQEVKRLFAAQGISFLDATYCPHHPTEGKVAPYSKVCKCRKPKPGMILELATRHAIDLSQSLMFGDKQCDLDAGVAAGCQSFDIKRVLEHGLFVKREK